jgi:carbon-monoxide dehydrogenase small subunit
MSMPELEHIWFDLNGRRRDALVSPLQSLAEVLRDSMGCRGVRLGCQQGGCGSCSVLIDNELKLACLVPVFRTQGKSIQTIEGLARGEELHPIQQAFVDGYATQCGYCTAGMIMATKALLDSNPDPTNEDVLVAISGNVCRCTGYGLIVQAVLDAARTQARREEKEVAAV